MTAYDSTHPRAFRRPDTFGTSPSIDYKPTAKSGWEAQEHAARLAPPGTSGKKLRALCMAVDLALHAFVKRDEPSHVPGKQLARYYRDRFGHKVSWKLIHRAQELGVDLELLIVEKGFAEPGRFFRPCRRVLPSPKLLSLLGRFSIDTFSRWLSIARATLRGASLLGDRRKTDEQRDDEPVGTNDGEGRSQEAAEESIRRPCLSNRDTNRPPGWSPDDRETAISVFRSWRPPE